MKNWTWLIVATLCLKTTFVVEGQGVECYEPIDESETSCYGELAPSHYIIGDELIETVIYVETNS